MQISDHGYTSADSDRGEKVSQKNETVNLGLLRLQSGPRDLDIETCIPLDLRLLIPRFKA